MVVQWNKQLKRAGESKYSLALIIDGGIAVQLAHAWDTRYTKKVIIASLRGFFTQHIFNRVPYFNGKVLIAMEGKNNYRKKLNSEYKANRPIKHLKWLDLIQEFMRRNGGVSFDELEADDTAGIIHTHHERLWERGEIDYRTIIVSADKDLLQLGGHFLKPKRGEYGDEFVYIDKHNAEKELWKQMLIGDVTDNVKGITGIGKVKAEKFIESQPLLTIVPGEVKKLYEKEGLNFYRNFAMLYIHRDTKFFEDYGITTKITIPEWHKVTLTK